METKFNFKSAICTDRFQSERLLALGLKKETADMAMCYVTHDLSGKEIEPEFVGYTDEPMPCEERQTILFSRQKFIPAWSLHRLIEMMPEEMYGGLLCIFKDSIRYEEVIMDRLEAHFEEIGDNMYENAISCIEWLIKEGYFNKEYLENGNN